MTEKLHSLRVNFVGRRAPFPDEVLSQFKHFLVLLLFDPQQLGEIATSGSVEAQ